MSRADGYARYEALRAGCEWSAFPATGHLRIVVVPGAPQQLLAVSKAQVCVRNASGPDGEASWVISRLGGANGEPISVGPGSWFGWDMTGGFPWLPLKMMRRLRGHWLNLTSFFLWPVHAANGSALRFPPLHNHHAILPSGAPPAQLDFLAHFVPYKDGKLPSSVADYWCGDDDPEVGEGGGGEACTLKELPPGYAWLTSAAPGGKPNVIINDVRARGESYAAYYELAYRVVHRARLPLRPAVGLEWFLPTTSAARLAGHALTDRIDGGMYQTFTLPPGAASLHFMEVCKRCAVRRVRTSCIPNRPCASRTLPAPLHRIPRAHVCACARICVSMTGPPCGGRCDGLGAASCWTRFCTRTTRGSTRHGWCAARCARRFSRTSVAPLLTPPTPPSSPPPPRRQPRAAPASRRARRWRAST